jgi:hypothetical protein
MGQQFFQGTPATAKENFEKNLDKIILENAY